jgi:hypothetical protein
VTSIESGGDKIHFSVEPTRTDESGGKEDHHSYRAVITAWRETDSGEEGQGQTETGPETNREILLSQPAIVWGPPLAWYSSAPRTGRLFKGRESGELCTNRRMLYECL